MTVVLSRFEKLEIKMEILHPNFLKELLQIQRLVKRMTDANENSTVNNDRHFGSKSVKNDSVGVPMNRCGKTNPRGLLKNNKSASLNSEKYGKPHIEITEKKRKNLKYILDEMIHFEHRFLESLRILKTITEEINLKHSKDNIGLREIFKDIPSLFQLHEHICQSLDKLKPEKSNEILPSVFVDDKEIPFLNIYKSFMCRYVVNYPSLVNYYNKDKEFASICIRNVQTSKFEEQKIQDVCGMYFGVHCSLTRFCLLITKLEESLSPDDKRMPSVKKALKVLSNILHVSEGEMVRQDKISDAQAAFAKMDGRELNFRHIPPLLREGPCKKIPRRSTHKRNLDRHLFLFSGYLVITEPANTMGRYPVKSELVLAGMNLSEVSEDDEISTPHCFRIKATELCVELAFSNETEKCDWWEAIQTAISQERGRSDSIVSSTSYSEKAEGHGTSAAEWVKDEQSTMCAECYAEFTVLHRRHHCRACGKVFCGSCSAYRAPIAFLGGKVKRVCVIDYYLINNNLKPPTTAIMEGILRRTQKESASVETGYLYWCQYSQGTWNAKPTTRAAKSKALHKYVSLNTSQSCNLTPTSPSCLSIKTDGDSQDSIVSQESSGQDKPHPKLETHRSGSLIDQTSRSNLSLNNLVSTSAAAKSHSASQLPNATICLCRMYTVLQIDTLLSMYAARADSRAKEQLPLLGTRLFYLEQVPNTPEPVSKGRIRSNSCTGSTYRSNDDNNCDNNDNNTRNTLTVHNSVQSSSSSLTSSVSQFSLNSKAESAESTPTPNLSSDSSENNCLVKPSQIKSGNPLYRNHKPPALPPKPEHLGELTNFRVSRVARKFESQTAIKPTRKAGGPPKSAVGFSSEETVKQLSSICPTVLSVLQNNLGFLLLPMNTDCLAHYFEAPSHEVRTKWINSIRQACIDYLNK